MLNLIRHTALTYASLIIVSALFISACGDDSEDACPRGQGISRVVALDSTRVEIEYACNIDQASAADRSHYAIANFTVDPEEALTITQASVNQRIVTLETSLQKANTTYTLNIDGVKDKAGNSIYATANFLSSTSNPKATIEFEFTPTEALSSALKLLISVDPQSGEFSPGRNEVALVKESDGSYRASLQIVVDPNRTADQGDDTSSKNIGFSARVIDAESNALSQLLIFEVLDTSNQTLTLKPIDDIIPVEGEVKVSFKVDDRPAQALSAPALLASFDDKGIFDSNFPTTIQLSDEDDDHIWEGTAIVKIDPKRKIGSTNMDELPYSVILIEGDKTHPGRSKEFEVLNDSALTVDLLIGAEGKIPVTFSVDVSAAWLTPDGSQIGIYPEESVFLTGGFNQAEDAFGQNAADSFTGGENVVLQMVEHPAKPGLWQRTIFVPKNRPYSWKVVRCPTNEGCTKLNKMVTSSGRAFPTVMKNLATELCDAYQTTFTDPECSSPKIIDPRDLNAVDTGSDTLNYSNATIYEGTQSGKDDQKDPANTPNASQMFKQESPDLVAIVAEDPIKTPVYVVGTWRDVNIGSTPQEIINGGSVIDLNLTDYDAGFIGGAPPSYELDEEIKVEFKIDGTLDSVAKKIAGTSTTMSFYAAISGKTLYIATEDAGEGSDHFILISATGTNQTQPAPWGKQGTVSFGGKTIFIADENDDNFSGIFELNPDTLLASSSNGTTSLSVTTPSKNGGVLEATINLETIFGTMPSQLWIAVAPWNSANGGEFYPQGQTPPTINGDSNIDSNEVLNVSIDSLKVSQ